jgi:hypothetical protein
MNDPSNILSRHLQDIATEINDRLQDIAQMPVGFCLVVFPPVDDGAVSYVSNCDRDLVQSALETLLEHWNAGMPDVPAHEKN